MHSAHQSDSRHRYLLGKPIYIWMNGGGEARPDQCTDIDKRSHARRLYSFWTHSLSLSLSPSEKIRNRDELLSKVCGCICVCRWQKRHCSVLADTTDRASREWIGEKGSRDTYKRHRLPPQSSVMVCEGSTSIKKIPPVAARWTAAAACTARHLLTPWSTSNYNDALTLSFCELQHPLAVSNTQTDTQHSYPRTHA